MLNGLDGNQFKSMQTTPKENFIRRLSIDKSSAATKTRKKSEGTKRGENRMGKLRDDSSSCYDYFQLDLYQPGGTAANQCVLLET